MATRSKDTSSQTVQIIIGAAVGAVIALLGLVVLFSVRATLRPERKAVASTTPTPQSKPPSPAPVTNEAASREAAKTVQPTPPANTPASDTAANDPDVNTDQSSSAAADAPANTSNTTAESAKTAAFEPPKPPPTTTTPAPEPTTRPPAPNNLQPGLLKINFPRHPKQKGQKVNVHLRDLGSAIDSPTVVNNIRNWKFAGGKNGVAYGYLLIDEPGEYVFKTYNFYDRNILIVGDETVCRYRGSVRGGTDQGRPHQSKERIQLERGFVPIAAIGFVDSRATMEVRWCPPGESDYRQIPLDNLWHDPTWPATNAADIWTAMQRAVGE